MDMATSRQVGKVGVGSKLGTKLNPLFKALIPKVSRPQPARQIEQEV